VNEFDLKIAWLAGLWDGEGSIGISGTKDRMAANAQMCMTCERTIKTAIDTMKELGIRAIGYTYQERDTVKHRDACYIRVNRMNDIRILASEMVKYSVTKLEHWKIISEFVTSRLEHARLDDGGRVITGGVTVGKTSWKPYTERERNLQIRISEINARGPSGRQRRTTSEYGRMDT